MYITHFTVQRSTRVLQVHTGEYYSNRRPVRKFLNKPNFGSDLFKDEMFRCFLQSNICTRCKCRLT